MQEPAARLHLAGSPLPLAMKSITCGTGGTDAGAAGLSPL